MLRDVTNAKPKTGDMSIIKRNRSRVPIIISVEAAIGTGKSTLLKLIEQHRPSWQVVQEPVALWQELGGNPEHNLLEAFYNDKERYAFSFQTYCVLSRIEVVKKAIAECPPHTDVIVLERSWMSDRHTFAEMLRQQGSISPMEWELYSQWYGFASKNSPDVHGHVYLKCQPSTCMTRLRRRNRQEECGVTQDYQASLIDAHERWLCGLGDQRSILTIDADDEYIHSSSATEVVLRKIERFVQERRRHHDLLDPDTLSRALDHKESESMAAAGCMLLA